MTALESERLTFRLWKSADYTYFQSYFSDPNHARFIGGVRTGENAWRLMATYLGHYMLNGFGYLALEEKTSGQFVGSVGLWKSEPWPELELGYWLWPQAQGRGFATEAGQACITYAKKVLAARSLVSYIDPENAASINVAERLGATLDKQIELLDFGPHAVYRYW